MAHSPTTQLSILTAVLDGQAVAVREVVSSLPVRDGSPFASVAGTHNGRFVVVSPARSRLRSSSCAPRRSTFPSVGGSSASWPSSGRPRTRSGRIAPAGRAGRADGRLLVLAPSAPGARVRDVGRARSGDRRGARNAPPRPGPRGSSPKPRRAVAARRLSKGVRRMIRGLRWVRSDPPRSCRHACRATCCGPTAIPCLRTSS